jgi:hypothetical protein
MKQSLTVNESSEKALVVSHQFLGLEGYQSSAENVNVNVQGLNPPPNPCASNNGNGRHDIVSTDVPEDDDESVNVLNELDNSRDENTILLLKQIFPDESADDLWQLHVSRCTMTTDSPTTASTPCKLELKAVSSSAAQPDDGENIHQSAERKNIGNTNVILSEDFLRLPHSVAVRRFVNGRWQYEFLQDMSQRVILQHEQRYGKLMSRSYMYCTKSVKRDRNGGLGMTLVSDEGKNNNNVKLTLVYVHSFLGIQLNGKSNVPASAADIYCNDIIIGVDGVAFAASIRPKENLLKHVVSKIRSGSDPIVLHLIRKANLQSDINVDIRKVSTPSLLDSIEAHSDDGSSLVPTGGDVSLHSDLSCSQVTFARLESINPTQMPKPTNNNLHPFIKILENANMFSSREELCMTSNMLNDFVIRAQQWGDLAAFYDPSTESLIPLVGVRKALSVRIVNIFDDDVDTAYTIWVYDVEVGQEWYAPVRYFHDFEDLRSATLPLCSASIRQIPFPRSKVSALNMWIRSPNRSDSNIQRETKCRQLENFLRSLCSMVYKEKLHPYIGEVAIHVQSFLGCEAQDEVRNESLPLPKYVELSKSTFDGNISTNDVEPAWIQMDARLRLKRTLQCYTYLIFLLHGMRQLVDQFVDRLRMHGPRLQDIEDLEAQGREILKARALADLKQIQSFINKVQNMVIEGCIGDFETIAERREYAAIHPLISGSKSDGTMHWEKLVREAVREVVEVEVYVPLRSVVSRWLVNGWRHDDMEVFFRMKELRRRPLTFFRMQNIEQNYDWSAVTTILNEGVGLSTLPCMKLNAIVDAAREIFRIIQQANDVKCRMDDDQQQKIDTTRPLGADDFLPIFIYCVVHAEMERPCALCVLLRNLCDPVNQIGEIGYYLLTFEAAIKHCEEVDLTDNDQEEMPSFQSIELDDD